MRKIIFYVVVTVICPFCLGLLSTYFYGLLFSNARYWETISNVQEIEINVLKNILITDLNEIVKTNNYNKFNEIFKPYYGKLYIEISKNTEVVFNNRQPNFEVKTYHANFNVNTLFGLLNFKIATYTHPTWNLTFSQWLLHNPFYWFSKKYDFICIPFLSFFFIWTFAGLAFAWRCRADYERDLLERVMEVLEIEKEEK